MPVSWSVLARRFASASESRITTREVANRLARTDQLTGIANSRAFYRTAEAELARVRRYGGLFTLAYFDIDDFKSVNDHQGHAGGDSLLKAFVRAIADATRETDTFARMGGDEFVLLMPQTGQEAAAAVLDKLAVHSAKTLSSNGATAGVSIGAVTFLAPPSSVDDMIREADEAMYAAKRGGKHRTVLRVHASEHGSATTGHAVEGIPLPGPGAAASPEASGR
jgi:diguanylate cyclase (GGDEF)-like protein